ncbi:uncharacterized protein ACB058_013196 [Synchiropus picturatus]
MKKIESLLLLSFFIAASSAQNTPRFLTHPIDVSVAVGDPAVFSCGVPKDSVNFSFNVYGSRSNHTLTCPDGRVEDVPQALFGHCVVKKGQLMAVWTIKGTSYSDNSTKFVCHLPNVPESPTAILHVHDNGKSFYILIGCCIGAFFGVLLVFGLSYTMLQRSETLQRCFSGKEDDTVSIIEKDSVKKNVKKEEF